MCKYFQESVKELSREYYSTLRRHNYVTPTSYLELILTFKTLLQSKRQEVDTMRNRYLTGLQKLNFAASQVSAQSRSGTSGGRTWQRQQATRSAFKRPPKKTASDPAFADLTSLASAETWPYAILSLFKILTFCSSWVFLH